MGWLATDEFDPRPEVEFGAELRRLRQQAGLTTRDLAKRLHGSHSSIVEWEKGVRLAPLQAVAQYEALFELRPGELALQRERARRTRQQLDAPLDAGSRSVACPYKGLEAFQPGDAALFFGREDQVDQVLDRLLAARFLAVIGPSGCGKSSFVRAGLVAAITEVSEQDGAPVRTVVLTPGEHPLDELARQISGVAADGALLRADDWRTDPQRLARVTRDAGPGGLVVVIDQFEELFTQCAVRADRHSFVDALLATWRDPASSVSVILTLRADFYGHLTEFPELADAVCTHQELLRPMMRRDLLRAIEQPAELCRLQLQPGLAQTMLDDLEDEPGALPLLSHALLETWAQREVTTLTIGGYRRVGSVRGAIAQTAESTYQCLVEGDQAIARSIFLRLTDVGDGTEPTRRRVERADIGAPGHSSGTVDLVLNRLAEARLLTIEQDTVVLAHEALIRHWHRLRGWIEADRDNLLLHRRLTDAAREWDALQREPAALYRGARLSAAREWAIDHNDELSGLEHDFLDASQASEQRATRRLRVLAAGLATLAAIAMGLAVVAGVQRNSAQRQSAETRRQAATATSLALTGLAVEPLKTRPDISLGLAFEAYRAAPLEEAGSATARALLAARQSGSRGVIVGRGAVFDIAFSPDGSTLASVGDDDGSIVLWDPATRAFVGRLVSDSSTIIDIAFSRSGKTLASAGDDGTILIWDVATRSQLVRLAGDEGPPGVVSSVAFSRDGELLASATENGTVSLWNPQTGKPLDSLEGHAAPVAGVAFSPRGTTLASAGADGLVVLWNAATRKPLGELVGHSNGVTAVAFSPDGKSLASASDDNTIVIWDVETQAPRQTLTGHTDSVYAVTFSPDGETLASAGADNTVRLWDPATGRALLRRTGHAHEVTGIAFSPDGRTLASAGGDDDTIRLWNPAMRTQRARLTGHSRPVNAVAFAPNDSGVLASGSVDGTVLRWNPAARTPSRIVTTHHAKVEAVAFSPDGATLASTSYDGTIRLSNPDTGALLARLGSHTGPLNDVAFSPDGRILVTGGSDGMVQLWDVRTRAARGRLSGHTNEVTAVAFSPNATLLASASDDNTIRIWDPVARAPRGRLVGHTGAVNAIAFSSDGRTLASAGDDGSIRLWDPVAPDPGPPSGRRHQCGAGRRLQPRRRDARLGRR